MNKFKVGDIVEVWDHMLKTWSRPYIINSIFRRDDEGVIGYSTSEKSFHLKSRCGEFTRTWFVEGLMKKSGWCPECDRVFTENDIAIMEALETPYDQWRCRGCS